MENEITIRESKTGPIYRITYEIEKGETGEALKNLVDYAKSLPEDFVSDGQELHYGLLVTRDFLKLFKDFLCTLEVEEVKKDE